MSSTKSLIERQQDRAIAWANMQKRIARIRASAETRRLIEASKRCALLRPQAD